MRLLNITLVLLFSSLVINCSSSGDGSSSVPVTEINTPTANPPEESPPKENPPVVVPPVVVSPTISLLSGGVQLIKTPNANGHTEFIASLNKTKSGDVVRMAMFHLTDNSVIDALVSAHKRGVTVKVILDGVSLIAPNFKLGFEKLKAGGVDVRESTSAFSISHQKSMSINNSEAFITAINLTKLPETTRDFGLIIHDVAVITEINTVFEQDWANAMNNQGITPIVNDPHLLWSPVNSLGKLVNFISSAKKSLIVNVENLGASEIQKALIAAAKRGVSVRIIVPMCSKNVDPKLNYPFLKELSSGLVQARIMPEPETVAQPYMHSKMMIADGTIAYVGSVNFSKNSTTKARELGIIFSETKPIQEIIALFEQDWKVSVQVPDENTVSCSYF